MSKYVRILVSVVLLGWFAWNLNWSRVAEAFAALRLELWLAAVAVLIAAQVVSAVRWRYLATALGFERPLRHVLGFYFIGMYFNLLLPTSVGGDVVRAWYLDGRSGRRMRALVSVFLDRLCGFWVLMAVAGVAVLLSPLPLPSWISGSVWLCVGAVALGTAALPLLVRHRQRAPWKFRTALEALHALPSRRALVWPTVLSVAVQAASVLIAWLVGEALGVGVPASFYWILVPMVSLLTLLPISVNGMGVREGATALLLAPFGVERESAVTLALLWFSVSAAVGLLGGLVYVFGRFPRPRQESEATAGTLSPQAVFADRAFGPTANDGLKGPAGGEQLPPDVEGTVHGPFGDHPDQGRARQYPAAA